jgi:Chaperone of endosialidase
MKKNKSLMLVVFAALVFACLQAAAFGQATNDKLASVAGGGGVRWDVNVPNSGLTLVVSAPDGRTFRKEYKSGNSADFALIDKLGERLPDGTYSYELRLVPVQSVATKDAAKGRASDDASEEERTGRKRATVPAQIQTGSFAIVNGSAVVAGAVEEGRRTAKAQPRSAAFTSGNTLARLRNHRAFLGAAPDDVIPDDLIVQGSACVGLDCVNGEVFGFDTVRLKENNTRLQFDDTSGTGFPTNNWQIRANSSASGGESFLGFVDQGSTGNSETGTIVLQVNAGAPANSVKVASNGKVGFRTATPVLDLHITTSDTPAHRLEQTNAGGFTAQTWDIAGNEANFFVRDVTGGSRLPFRIRPGAPTSSIDINANGQVGVGTASPGTLNGVSFSSVALHAKGSGTSKYIAVDDSTNVGVLLNDSSQAVDSRVWGILNQSSRFSISTFSDAGSPTERLSVLRNGRVGIGTTVPDQTFSVNGDASKSGGGSWQSFSDERLKNIKGNFNSGLKAVMQLQPLRYEYKKDNALGLKSEGEHIGFGAQALEKIIPEAVTMNSTGYRMVNNDPILWTMLNAIKEQQQEIAELKGQVRRLQATSRRHRK